MAKTTEQFRALFEPRGVIVAGALVAAAPLRWSTRAVPPRLKVSTSPCTW